MSEAVVAKRYAEALFQLGTEKKALDHLEEEASVVQEIFGQNKKLLVFLTHPRVANEKKKQFLTDVFKGLSADLLNTMKLLVDRNRIDLMPVIVKEFLYLTNEAKGISEATVFSVRALSDDEIEKLSGSFAKRFGKKAIKLENKVDPSIIGGIKLRMGNSIYDGSISGKLKRIERSIVTANK
ncbi:F0F1 ATP synthase subunit delta [Virgibacillus phasianinus]|uniref:ATP synthase subunit delta n=1 Tax=Virgibacillus phasianinus TaxID=2017483 RepID=A0A220U2C5_9BACI|nr:F0F1 ATP synthase subunit delta [Virgibacillus phasianinus]ASK62086.1 F0F1 ATP synthase subunit delta [Virgibacillus phasianinus]